jgi:Outer membrane protein beta-barrel domain
MKKFHSPVFCFLLILIPLYSGAQLKAGYVFGVNLATLDMKGENLLIPPKTTVNFHFGGSIELPVAGNLSFQPELLFSAKGSDYNIDSTSISLSPIYLEAPVNLVYSIGTGIIRLQLLAGPYGSIGIGGYKIVGKDQLQYLKFNNRSTGDLRPFDYGFNFGAAICIKNFTISARYEKGLANTGNSQVLGSEMKNKVIAISVSSLFAFKSEENQESK